MMRWICDCCAGVRLAECSSIRNCECPPCMPPIWPMLWACALSGRAARRPNAAAARNLCRIMALSPCVSCPCLKDGAYRAKFRVLSQIPSNRLRQEHARATLLALAGGVDEFDERIARLGGRGDRRGHAGAGVV